MADTVVRDKWGATIRSYQSDLRRLERFFQMPGLRISIEYAGVLDVPEWTQHQHTGSSLPYASLFFAWCQQSQLIEDNPIDHFRDAEEIAHAVLFLCSE